MSSKIRRGLRGQLERGFATGGATYGYTTTPIPDSTRPGEFVGHRIEIEPIEASVVRQVFEWFADGIMLTTIIRRLHEQGTPAPRKGCANGQWRRGAIRRMLANTRYTGQLVWGRTRAERRPGSRRVRLRAVPQSDWHIAERPELRIVPDALWQRVQARRRQLKEAVSGQRQPGRTLLRGAVPSLHGQQLFAGALRCGVCGKTISVVSTNKAKKRLYRYYGCGHFARNGVTACTNQVTVAVDLADRYLLAGLDAELRRDTTVQYIADRLTSALRAHADARPKRHEDLTRQREVIHLKIQRLVLAVEDSTSSTSLLGALAAREAEATALDADLGALEAPLDDTKLAVIPTFVRQQLSNLSALLQDDPDRLKAHLARLGVVFTLHPVYDVPSGQRPYLRAVGEGQYEHLVAGSDPAFGLPVRSLR